MIGVGQIIKGCEVDREDAHGCASHCNRWDDPRNGGVGRPSEPEQTDWHEQGLDADEVEPSLSGFGESEEALCDAFLVDAYGGYDDDANTHGWKLSARDLS